MDWMQDAEIVKMLWEHYPGIVGVFSVEGKLLFSNDTFNHYFVGNEWANVMEKILEKERIEQEWHSPGGKMFSLRYLLPDGRVIPLSVFLRILSGNIRLFTAHPHYEVVHREIVLELDKLKEECNKYRAYAEGLKKKMEEWEHTDPLTEVYHRKYFLKILDTEWSRAIRYGHTVSLIVYDIDGLKGINMQYGPDYGDTVLREISLLVAKIIRKSDVLGRYEGGTFLVLLPETDAKKAFPMAERLRENIMHQQFYAPEGAFSTTASFGITQAFCVSNDTPELFIKRGLRALARSKQLGKNRIEIFLM
ncbi:MAG: GGDEF domain-containing protein [bacterium JZ-2024 1]